MKIQDNPNKQIPTSTKSSVPWSYLRDWSFISSRRGRTWGGSERCGVPKLALSPPKIIALENCTPLCQEQFLKSTPPPLQPLQVSSSILAGRWFHKLYKDTDSQQRRVRFEGARTEKVSQRVWGMFHQKIFKFRVSEMPSPAFSVRHFQYMIKAKENAVIWAISCLFYPSLVSSVRYSVYDKKG